MSADSGDLVVRARSRLRAVSELDELRAALLELAPSFHHAVRRRRLDGLRPDLKLDVKLLDIGYSGLAVPRAERTLVLLNRSERTSRRRFTLAHELGHALLIDVDRDRLRLDRRTEDRLCQRFAAEVLMPAEELTRYFLDVRFPQTLAELQKFCRRFMVGASAAVVGLARHHPRNSPMAFIVARRCSHTARSPQVALRVHVASTPPGMLAPRCQRLSSLGLRELVQWAERAGGPGAKEEGCEQMATLRSRRTGVTQWAGQARWQARVLHGANDHGAPLQDAALLALLDTSTLAPLPSLPRRSAARSSGVLPGIQGQTRLYL